MHVVHARMMTRFSEAEYQASPDSGTRKKFAHTLFPQLERLDADAKARSVRRMNEWVDLGPVLLRPQEGALDGPKPRPVPVRGVPLRLR